MLVLSRRPYTIKFGVEVRGYEGGVRGDGGEAKICARGIGEEVKMGFK